MTGKKRGGTRKKTRGKGGKQRNPFSSLMPEKNMGRRQDDVLDVQEYVNLLNPEEKLWMAKFMDEYNNAKYDSKDLSNNLHNTPELKKTITDRNNHRNSCIYTREKAKGMLNYASSDSEMETYLYGVTEEVVDEDEFTFDPTYAGEHEDELDS